MATGREERMQQRMRGAQRHQVTDASFDLFLPAVADPAPSTDDAFPPPSPPAPATTTTSAAQSMSSSTPAKRRRLDDSGGSATAGLGADTGAAPQHTPRDALRRPSPRRGGSASGSAGRPRSAASLIVRHVAAQIREEEEIDESPADAPGSGRRRSVVVSAAASRTAALQQIVLGAGVGDSSQRQRTRIMAPPPFGERAAQHQQVPSSSSPPPPSRPLATTRDGRGASVELETGNIGSSSGSNERRRRSVRLSTGADADNMDELSPELSALAAASSSGGVGVVAPQPPAQPARDTSQAKGGGSLFARLANAKKSAAAGRAQTKSQASAADPDAVDELSSPSFAAGLDATDNVNATMTGSIAIPSSSPLAHKSTVGAAARAARAARALQNPSGPRRSTLSSLSSRSSRGSLIAAAAAATVASEATPSMSVTTGGPADPDQDELSPDQPGTVPQVPSQAALTNRNVSEVPSSSPANRPPRRRAQQSQEAQLPAQPAHASSSPQQRGLPSNRRRPRDTKRQPPAAAAEEDTETAEAEEIDALEAARTIGRKRPRRSAVHEASPELGSDPKTAEPTDAAAADGDHAEVPAPKRRRRQRRHLQEQSPSSQNQPRPPKSKGKQAAAVKPPKPPARRKRRQQNSEPDQHSGNYRDDDDDAVRSNPQRRGKPGSPSVPITVQRFTRSRASAAVTAENADSDDGDDDDDDSHTNRGEAGAAGGRTDNPFANRSGVNAVDVLAQICEDLIEQRSEALLEQARRRGQDGASNNDAGATAAARKDAVAARRVLAAFREALRTRLLEQAIAVDTLHALRQRVRAAHKEKLALREAILRIRAEREQVALRMDALRMQHQVEKERAMKTARISAVMHDVDLAVEQGQAAPPLSATQKKTAELGNLELAVSRVVEQVGGPGGRGGTLQQIMAFNAFLERTAAVLEGRRPPAQMAAAR
ncbi:hypothetical protein SPI_07037 [Niveomyces insectorum RCEF 264]|uniref:Inner kinetochore subunit AME1 domain-containing protein n=1 Tax=Niveomyces insectorum RCEF 264 TaxID=1081102 RepID=A0A167Q7P9_9HYPO|nr:hypothetical protein SPI_07037 [Niveomyces insectorum RCEF 264]